MRILLSLLLCGFIVSAHAEDYAAPEIDPATITLERLDGAEGEALPSPHYRSAGPALYNSGQNVFEVIKDNKPVIDPQSSYASALPKGYASAQSLYGWKQPMNIVYRWSAKNMLGKKVVEFRYQLTYQYGGSVTGRGRYLAGVSVLPVSLKVDRGYTVNMTCEVPASSVVNVGSKRDPVAALDLVLAVSVRGNLKAVESRDVFYIQGDGVCQKTTSDLIAH